tara:strand:+ start:110 stop:268 length:159 start_codon:yes stop_codon:yes gene_type:complete
MQRLKKDINWQKFSCNSLGLLFEYKGKKRKIKPKKRKKLVAVEGVEPPTLRI